MKKQNEKQMKNQTKKVVSVLCAAALLGSGTILGACGGKKDENKNVTISGSSSVTPLMEKLAAAYEQDHDVRITVNMSSSGAGISDTQNDLNDFGMSSRKLKDEEKGIKGETLCMDGIALIVNKECAVTDVKKADVKALYENGTAIPDTTITAAIGRDASSGTRSAFDELLKITNGYFKDASLLTETGNVIEAIQNSTNSIGYISYGSLNDNVKAVSLDGVACTVENIKSGTYALQRPFVIVLKDGKTLSEAAQGFYDYIMGTSAQTVISKAGYITMK
ncbi:MAG: substrate-binding domain-containing protein [Christensenellaceae bacterium]